jgi:hypothetical protein
LPFIYLFEFHALAREVNGVISPDVGGLIPRCPRPNSGEVYRGKFSEGLQMNYLFFVLTTFLWNFINVSGSRSKLSNSGSYVFISSGAVSIAYVLSLGFGLNLLVAAREAHRWDQFLIAVILYGIAGAFGTWGGWKWSQRWEAKHNISH